MHPFKNIIFDLDGTLSNPIDGILNSLRYALQRLGIQNLPDSVPEEFIGPPLQHGFQTVFQLDSEATHKAVAFFANTMAPKDFSKIRFTRAFLNCWSLCKLLATDFCSYFEA